MKRVLFALTLCLALVPLPPKRGDGSPVKYVHYRKAHTYQGGK